jgi:O-antigen/teichoic acid export membrane protein
MSVRRSLAWSYGAQAFVFVVGFTASVLVARILGPYDMGIFALGMSTAGVLSILSAFGIAPYLMRHEEPDALVKATSFTINAILNLLVASAILAIALVGPSFGLNHAAARVLSLLSLAPIAAIFEFLPSTFLQREMKFRLLSLLSMGRAICSSVLLLGSAWVGAGSMSPAIAIVGSSFAIALAINVVARRHASVRIAVRGWREITRFGLQMMSIGGLAILVQRSSELILARLLGVVSLGVYSRASSLSNQIWDNVYGLGTRVIFARMAEEQRATGTVRVTFLRGAAMMTALIWPLTMGIAVLSGPLVHMLYGDAWSAAAAPLSILLLAQAVALAFGMNWELCVLRNRTGWQARNEAIRAVTGLAAFTLGSSVSLVGAAAGRVVESLTGLALYGPTMREMAGTSPGELARVYRQGAVLALVAVGPSAILMAAHEWSVQTSWETIVGAICLGIALWFAALWWFSHPLLEELKRAGIVVMQFTRR